MRPSTEPEPPAIACELGATEEVPDWPENWLQDGAAWAVEVLGILTEERQLRAEEHRCLDEHRRNGAIR